MIQNVKRSMSYLKKRKKKKKQRTYNEEYIKLGFIECPSDETKPQCLACNKILSNKSMKPANLKRHLRTQHPDLIGNPQAFFERKKKDYLKQKKDFSKTLVSNEKLMKASYLVALRVARAMKPHTIAKDLILPAAIDMCETVLDRECTAKLKEILLSNNTISRRIGECQVI